MGRGGVESGCSVAEILPKQVVQNLRRTAQEVDEFYGVVGGDRAQKDLAQFIHDIRGDEFSGVPQDEKPKLNGNSLRVAAQRHANRRQG